jgi:hypothetical protein
MKRRNESLVFTLKLHLLKYFSWQRIHREVFGTVVVYSVGVGRCYVGIIPNPILDCPNGFSNTLYGSRCQAGNS